MVGVPPISLGWRTTTYTRSFALFLSAILLLVGCSHTSSTSAATKHPQKVSNAALERDTELAAVEFRTGKDGRPLLVSVVWNGEPLAFLLDTGATRTGFDSSLKSRLGEPVGRTTLQTSAGLVETEEFACPDVTVGGLPLDGIETVFCTDLQRLRYASGEDIRGVLGVDFLRRFTVTIDFDQGLVQLCESCTTDIH